MRYNHKKRLIVTSRRETQLLTDAKKLLFEMLRFSGCRSKKISAAYQHLSILLEQYRFRQRKRMSRMGKMRLFIYRLFH